jgi:hypothetical protein
LQFISTVTTTVLSIFFQDTLKTKFRSGADTLGRVTDSLPPRTESIIDTNAVQEIKQFIPASQIPSIIYDTVSVCPKSPITGITFYDPYNIAMNIDKRITDRFPFVFTSSVRDFREEKTAMLVQKLRPGENIQANPFHIEWIIPLIFISALILGIIRTIGGNFFRSMARFISFQGINDSGSRESADLYQLPATLLNLGSFISISLFAYMLTIRYGIIFPRLGGFLTWAIGFGIIIVAMTIRHVTCIITGNISDQPEAFSGYLKSIYEAYRIAGIFLLIIVILVVYTSVIPEKVLFNAGIFGVVLLYIIRVTRLLLIFIKRHISLFYYILYLCALEILPVVVLVKYLTGLV